MNECLMFKDLKIMKTNIITNNTIMNNVFKYLCAVLLIIGTCAHAWGQAPSLSITERVSVYATDFTNYNPGGANGGSVGVVTVATTANYRNDCSGTAYIRLTSGSTMTVSAASGKLTQIHFSPMTSGGCSGNGMDGKFSANSGTVSGVTWYNSTGVSSVIFTASATADFYSFTVTISHTSSTCPFTFPTSVSFSVASGDDHTETVNISGTTGYTWNGSSLSSDALGGSSATSELSDYSASSNDIYVVGDVPGTYYGTLDVEYNRYSPYSYYEISIPVTVTVTGCVDISGSNVTGVTLSSPTWDCTNNRWEATASCNAVANATKYGFQLKKYNGSSWVNDGDIVWQTGRSKTYTSLVAGTRYKVEIKAKNDGCVPNSTTGVTTSSEITPTCPTPSSLSVAASSITGTSALLTWGASGGTAGCSMTYTVTVTNHSTSATVWSQSPASATTSHSLTGLTTNTRYDVSLTAYNDCGNSTSKTDYYFSTEKGFVNYVYTCIDLDLIHTDYATDNSAIKITSATGQKVKSARTLTLTISGASSGAVVNISAPDILFYKSDGTLITSSNLTCNASGVLNEVITIAYNPTSYVSESFATPTISVSCDGNNLTFENFITARCLPDNFVIVSKWGDNWYALTANCGSSGTYPGIAVAVDNVSDPTQATFAPTETKWGMREVASGRYAANGANLVFTERLTTATANSQKTLYNGSTTNIQVWNPWSTYANTNPERYEWTPSSTNLKDYTLTSADGGNARPLCLSTSCVFGTYSSGKAYDGQVRILPATFVDPAEMQVVEWKASSVVVMYTGSGVTATTKLGSGDEGSGQSLSSGSVNIDHGVFELSTGSMTSAANQTLVITIKNSSSAVVGKKVLIVPAIVSGAKNADALGFTTAQSPDIDVVVLDGATLSAVATKYTYNNITVYPGGKLVIGKTDKQLGMASLTLRGGSSWGAASYEYKYPQFVVNNTASGAYSNSSATINYDYVTTKAQYYSFVLPYNGSTSTIKYPVDIYGSNVAKNNTGSFEFQYYDGSARAGGGSGWATLAEPATLVAGTGYTFLGMPKKVDAYNGSDEDHSTVRQTYGIHRIPMSVSAASVQSGENPSNPGKPITLSVTLADKNNDSGWNLIGNPYLSEVSGLSNTDIQVGKLVHTDDAGGNWTGRWHWDTSTPATNQRFVVIPGHDGQTYESQQASTAVLPAFKNFFVQISNGSATELTIPKSGRTDINLMRALFGYEPGSDIELAVDLVSETRSDKVDLLINDAYSDGFDQDADFTKMMNGTRLNIYGVYPGDNLSFIAVDKTTASQSIAIGYQVPEAGEYSLQLSDRPYVMSDRIEALYVTDHEMEPEITTDLKQESYAFTVNQAETNDTRFTFAIKFAPKNTTDIEVVPDQGDELEGEKTLKFIYQDKMYILHNNILYDATGKRVKTINK